MIRTKAESLYIVPLPKTVTSADINCISNYETLDWPKLPQMTKLHQCGSPSRHVMSFFNDRMKNIVVKEEHFGSEMRIFCFSPYCFQRPHFPGQ